jgi:hypothetical protein
MREFMVLIGQLCLIALVQMVLESFIDSSRRPLNVHILNIACILGCVYLLMQFVFGFLLNELSSIVTLPF